MKNLAPIFLSLILGLAACQSSKTVSQRTNDNQYLYQESVVNSMSPDQSKIYTHLVPINPQNKDLVWKKIEGEDYVLVVTWKQDTSYYRPYPNSDNYNTGNYQIWVTTAPELLKRMKKEKTENADLRLKQLLGLPPNARYSYFIEFWVRPRDMFRPCPDNEITDSQCDLCFPDNVDSSYVSWMNSSRISRYYPRYCTDEKYPWTQLGYTYDWNADNKSHVGLSEYVIGMNKNIVINAIYTTNDYLQKDIKAR